MEDEPEAQIIPAARFDVAQLETIGGIVQVFFAASQAHSRPERLVFLVELGEHLAKVDVAMARRPGALQQPLQQPLLVLLEVAA